MDLSRLGRRSFISQSGIAEVLAAVKDAGELPEGISRSSVKRKRQQAVDVTTPYGKLLHQWEFDLTNGGKARIYYSPPAAAVYHSSKSSGMNRLLSEKLLKHPCNLGSEWEIVVYLDEVAPGNQLKSDNRRKLWCLYYTRSCSLTITSLRSSLGSFWPRCGLSWFSSSRVVFQNSSEEHCGLSIPEFAIFLTAFSCILPRSFLGGLPCCLETKLPSKLHLNARERLERSYVFCVIPHCKSDTHPTILRSHGCFTHARTLQSSDSTEMSRCGKLLICWQRGPGQKQKNGCQLDTFSLFLFRFP